MAFLGGMRRRVFRYSFTASLSIILLSVFTLQSIRSYLGRKSRGTTDAHFSRWVIPTDVDLITSQHTITVPANWTLVVPQTVSLVCNCNIIHHSPGPGHKEDDARDWNSDSLALQRRMNTALFVLKHGAVGILLSSDLASVNTSSRRLLLDNQPYGVRGLEYYGPDLTLDAFHFLHRSQVAPGNPCLYRFRTRMRPLWVVAVRCRFTQVRRERLPSLLKTHIDTQAPPVATPVPRFDILSFEDAFFDFDGVWAMFVAFIRVRDNIPVWGLWAQRLLQEIGGEMTLTSLPCSKESLSGDTPLKTSARSKQAFDLVQQWSCPDTVTFFQCGLQLAGLLLDKSLIAQEEVRALGVWLQELRVIRYPEPKRIARSGTIDDLVLGCVIYNPAFVELNPQPRARILFPHFKPFCEKLPWNAQMLDPFRSHFVTGEKSVRDIALVIIFFDSSVYSNIVFSEDLYRNHFDQIIYCGPDSKIFQTFYKMFRKPITYLEVPDTKGFVAYECVSRAIMMNLDVAGFLQIADDVLLNAWTIKSIPRDRFWFQKDLRIANRHQETMNDFAMDFPFPWWPWTVNGQMWGAKAMAKVWTAFHAIRQSDNRGAEQIVKAFLATLQLNSGSDEHFFYSSSDVFYVPSLHRQAWAIISEIFYSNHVFLDIAVPTLMNGLALTSDIVRMEGVYLWYNDRINFRAFYQPSHQFFHPWKMSWMQNSKNAEFVCSVVLPCLVHDLKVREETDLQL